MYFFLVIVYNVPVVQLLGFRLGLGLRTMEAFDYIYD